MSVTISSDHSKKTIDGMKLAAISLGCAKNRIDTEEILGYLAKRGVILTDDHQHADIIIVNTCGFIEEAQQESIDTLLGLTGKHRNHTPIIIAAGCLVEVYGSKIIDSLPEIAGAIGVHSYHHLEQMLDQILSGQRVVICDTPSSEYSSLAPRILTTPVHSAAVKIAEGCSNRCHYCRIPSIRGPYRSRPVKEIVSEIESLINNGTREINLVAQDTTAYGTDSEEFPDLAGLIREILSLKNNFWLRLMYAYPSRISDHLIELIVTEKRICKYLDIPIQHANSRMIQQMGRHYDKGDLVHIVEKLKSRMPELALRTTCMVGFPGETQRQFQEMLNFIQQYPFERLGAFTYSCQENTVAAQMEKQIPQRVMQKRHRTLMLTQQKIAHRMNSKLIGLRLIVLVEKAVREGSNWYFGRTEYQAPEVDGGVYFRSRRRLEPGTWVSMKICAASHYNLLAIKPRLMAELPQVIA